jgi:adenosylmethionine-8-amino-7-oxononanoate aminotransferase
VPASKSELLERDCSRLIHSLHNRTAQQSGHVWVRGEGTVLTDADGKEYLDGLSGLWNVVLGHGRWELAEAAARQMNELAYCTGYAGGSNPRAIELAERLAAIMYPSISRFFFTSGGAEATEASVKTARYYWRMLGQPEKTKAISRQWGYHGTTLAAMSATGMSNYWPMFEPRVPGFIHIPSPYPYRYEPPVGVNQCGVSQGVAAANELEAAILREGPETVAMFIAEPVQGGGGVIVPQDDYFPRIRQICDQYQVLFVADEVITGFGRTGSMFALDHWGVQPDIVQFAKGITSGYFPLGGIGVREEIALVLDAGKSPWMHAYTYSGHPVGCAVALQTIDILQRERLADQAKEKGQRLLTSLRRALADHPQVGDIRGKGLMCAVEYVQDKATKQEFPAQDAIGPRIHIEAQRRGLVSRLRGDVFLLAPPYITNDQQLDRIVEILREATDAVFDSS